MAGGYPENRYSLDQVPCMLEEGDGSTYHFKGAKQHVWVASFGKGDAGKRYCTFQLIARLKTETRRSFTAVSLSPKYVSGARVCESLLTKGRPRTKMFRFQPKAWYDDATLLAFAEIHPYN